MRPARRSPRQEPPAISQVAEDDAIRRLVEDIVAVVYTHPEETRKALVESIVAGDSSAAMTVLQDDALAPWLRSRPRSLGLVNWRLVAEATKATLILLEEGLPCEAGGPGFWEGKSGEDVKHLIPRWIGTLLLRKPSSVRIDLDDVDLGGALLAHRNLTGVSLRRAFLRYADLTRANLYGVTLRGADLHGAVLCGADLSKADLGGANLEKADLRGVNLDGANLTDAHLSRARWDDKTKWSFGAGVCHPRSGDFAR